MFRQFMRMQVFVYRRSSGKRMGTLRGMPVLLLTTVGRKTGKQRVTPVMYMREGNDFVVTASNNGRDKQPGWFLNLMAHPQITIEVAGTSKSMTAVLASAEEKERLWHQLVERAPFFDGYQKSTTRDIPMVILRAAD
jgi:F420H(2)-dependent quinone reductase